MFKIFYKRSPTENFGWHNPTFFQENFTILRHLMSTNESENLTVSLRESARESMFELQLNSARKVDQSQTFPPPHFHKDVTSIASKKNYALTQTQKDNFAMWPNRFSMAWPVQSPTVFSSYITVSTWHIVSFI